MSKLLRKFPGVARARRPKLSPRAPVKAEVQPHSKPPRELMGRWVAWSRDGRILASDDKLAPLVEQFGCAEATGVSYEKLPPLGRLHTH